VIAAGRVPVYRAKLPPAAALLPYLERLDVTRHYANRGELVETFEARLRDVLRLGDRRAVTAASGTAALQAAILAAAGRATAEKPLAIVPGYTFVATALAAEACGYKVLFADIAADGWMLDPAAMRLHPALGRAGVVLPAAPYGVAPAQAAWAEFFAASAVPVVIDAAASFEAIRRNPAGTTGTVPVCLSFHATKAFSTGEGGAVIWSDIAGLKRVAQALNFGFLGSRACRAAGFNGKLSEYHAAVGLAGLDGLAATDAARAAARGAYRDAARACGITSQLLVGPEIAANYALFAAGSAGQAAAVCASLQAAGVDYRFWYGAGVQREPYFAPQPALPHAEALAARLVGIPVYDDIGDAEIALVTAALAAAYCAVP
jgi:dTDP-4-amino-4,6-dideoxygalactose transaminase